MDIKSSMTSNPMTWKDWVSAAGVVLTMGTVLIQGGRLVERQEATNRKIEEATSKLTSLSETVTRIQVQMAKSEGVDALHAEQINILRSDVTAMKSGRKSN